MTGETLKLNAFGRELLAVRGGSTWQIFYTGAEGKRRLAEDIVVEDGLDEDQLVQALADLLHEWARPGFDELEIIARD